MAVYLLHFLQPISGSHTTQHYLGYAKSVNKRIHEHREGTSGVRLLAVAQERGIDFVVVRVWKDGNRALERKLKKQHNGKRLCPICNPPKI